MATTQSTVTTLHNGKTKTVKNLGWLLRNSKFVTSMNFQKTPSEFQDGILIVALAIGNNMPTHEYRTGFADFEVLKDVISWNQYLRHIPLIVLE